MSADALSTAVLAIQEVKLPAADGSAQAATVRRLEESLYKSEETGALSAHQFDEAQIRANKAETASMHLAAKLTEIQNTPETPGSSLQDGLMNYWNSFSNRTQNFELGRELAPKVSDSEPAAVQLIPVSMKGKPHQGNSNFGVAIQSLQKSFAFAIETSLVSNISHQSTRTLNSLLRGQ